MCAGERKTKKNVCESTLSVRAGKQQTLFTCQQCVCRRKTKDRGRFSVAVWGSKFPRVFRLFCKMHSTLRARLGTARLMLEDAAPDTRASISKVQAAAFIETRALHQKQLTGVERATLLELATTVPWSTPEKISVFWGGI